MSARSAQLITQVLFVGRHLQQPAKQSCFFFFFLPDLLLLVAGAPPTSQASPGWPLKPSSGTLSASPPPERRNRSLLLPPKALPQNPPLPSSPLPRSVAWAGKPSATRKAAAVPGVGSVIEAYLALMAPVS